MAPSADASTIVVGSANFPESRCSPRSTPGARRPRASRSTKKLNIGSREAYIPALKDGSIDLIPEYTGVLLQYFNKDANGDRRRTASTPSCRRRCRATLTVLDKSAAEDKDAVVVTKATADEVERQVDRRPAGKCRQLTVGGPPEWKTRPTGIPGLKKIYGLDVQGRSARSTPAAR